MRRVLVPALVSLGLTVSGLALAASPAAAEAAFTTSFGALGTATAGHVTGTVTTDAPYVEIAMTANGDDYVFDRRMVKTVDGGADFDLVTWGLATGTVLARACAAEVADDSCDPAVASAAFVAKDVAPEINWPEDTTIGSGQRYEFTVTDPAGGGRLEAFWDPDGVWMFEGIQLEAPGPNILPLMEDGTGQIEVKRCHRTYPSYCRTADVTRQLTVNRRPSHSVVSPFLGEINPDVGTDLRPVIQVNEGQDYTLDWHVRDSLTHEVVLGVGGRITGLVAEAGDKIRPVLDVSGVTVTERNYEVKGTLSYADPDFDSVSGPLNPMWFRFDKTPAILSVSRSRATVSPYADGYQDTVTVTLRPRVFNHQDYPRIEIVNASGVVVRELTMDTPDAVVWSGIWNGRTDSGRPVPAGTYKLRGVLPQTDHISTLEQGSITVVRKKLVARALKRTVSATGTLEHLRVGRCSTLRKPSARGWAGSIGLYSNTRCRRTFDASLVQSIHALQMPRAARYGDFRVSAYGGAARSNRRSLAYIGYVNRRNDLVANTRMSPTLGTHHGATKAGSNFVFDDRFVVWTTYTAKGGRYDIKNFTVTLKYQVLVAE